MAGASITITADDPEVQEAIARLGRAITRRTWDEIGSMMVASTQQRFEEQKGPDGRAWTPLAESTRQAKRTRRRRRGADNILRIKGHLYRSITHVATDRDAIIGTNRRYAALHQFGGKADMRNAGARAVPARPYLGFSKQDRDEILRTLARQLSRS